MPSVGSTYAAWIELFDDNPGYNTVSNGKGITEISQAMFGKSILLVEHMQ